MHPVIGPIAEVLLCVEDPLSCLRRSVLINAFERRDRTGDTVGRLSRASMAVGSRSSDAPSVMDSRSAAVAAVCPSTASGAAALGLT
jgi:hypothetical protein